MVNHQFAFEPGFLDRLDHLFLRERLAHLLADVDETDVLVGVLLANLLQLGNLLLAMGAV